jgi:hypothetical protein
MTWGRMSYQSMKPWLIVWGILAFVALAAPGIVAIGMLLVLPGLIFIAAPTVFLYSAAFALFRRLLPFGAGLTENVTAAGLSLVLGWVVAQPWAIAEHRAFARANLPEVLPSSPVKLGGNIRLELPKNSFSVSHDRENCNMLCAALLETPYVGSVTLAETGQPAKAIAPVYSLIPREPGDRSGGVYPVKPEAILDELPRTQEPDSLRNFEARLAAKKKDEQAVVAAWGLRLATRQKLVAQRMSPEADLTVRITQDRAGAAGVSVSRVEILDKSGRALLRRSIVVGSALSSPLRFNGTGGIEDFRVGLSRDKLRNGLDYPPLKPITELFRHTSLAEPEVHYGQVMTLLDRLRSATSNSALTRDDPDFALAELWLPTLDWRHPSLRTSYPCSVV